MKFIIISEERGMEMKKGTFVVLAALLVLAIISSVALAWTPEGQKGYEGQPGNQGGR
jgi:hypothetical protein